MNYKYFLILGFLLINIPQAFSNSYGNDTVDYPSLYDIVAKSNEVVFHISEPIKLIKKNYNKEIVTKGNIRISTQTDTLHFSAKLEPGGKNRREICNIPPIKIDVKKEELITHSLNKHCDKVKLVFQCMVNKSKSESIKQEKFVYDLHALVTDYSRRASLVKVQIADKEKFYDALLLEDNKDMDVRLNLKRIKTSVISPDVINRPEYVKMCLFQFMIANSDWSAILGHNTELYKRDADDMLIIVPYDFDYAGIINNDYAVPSEKLPIEHVTQRYFMDKKLSLAELEEGVKYFIAIEKDIYQLAADADYLSEGSRKRMTQFIEDFYGIIKNEKKRAQLLK